MIVLVTGAAGFIGYHLSLRLMERGCHVVGFDNINSYYDPALKRARLAQLEAASSRTRSPFRLIEGSLEDGIAVEEEKIDVLEDVENEHEALKDNLEVGLESLKKAIEAKLNEKVEDMQVCLKY